MAEISVVVPVYNSERYLRDCIQSVLNQTFSDFELILIDDGSTDSSPAICDEFAKNDDRIIVVHKPNKGQAIARNTGVSLASSEWICFVDSDDIIHSAMIEDLFQAVNQSGAAIATCGYVEANKIPNTFYEKKLYTYSKIVIDESTLLRYRDESVHYWCICGCLISKEIILNNPFTENRIYEDNAIACQWLCSAQIVADSQTPLYFYRVNDKGTTKGIYSLKRLDILWSREVQIDFYIKKKYFQLVDITCKDFFVLARWQYNQIKKYNLGYGILHGIKRRTRKLFISNHKHLSKKTKIGYLKDWKPRTFALMKQIGLIA